VVDHGIFPEGAPICRMDVKVRQVQRGFTPRQQDAIAHTRGNLQLIACAGSGKTEVVAQRVVTLLRPVTAGGAGCAPENIVAFTFTEKAAAELKERIHKRCQEQLGGAVGLADLYVGTIHGYCLELLKTEVPAYLKFEVLNEVQLSLFVDRHSKSSGLTQSTTLNGVPLKRYIDTKTYISALAILREDEVIAPELLSGNSVANNRANYERLLHDKGYLDYSGILAEAVRELRGNEGLRQRLAARIRHVIVDEYQDVNPIQEAVAEELHALGASICVVERHLRAPYAYPALREKLAAAARRVIDAYIRKNERDFSKVEFSEKAIEIALGDGVSVVGRIDLVRRLDTGETTIVDLKSSDRTQSDEVTETQLHIYALGYQELTGRRADYVEIYELDDQRQKRRPVGDEFIDDVKRDVRAAAQALRENKLIPKPTKKSCGNCDYCNLCSAAIRA